jgi:tRNA(fMet)-specific endonuclease VapC
MKVDGKYLIDTNIAIALLANDPGVLQRIRIRLQTFASVVTLGELYYGAIKSARSSENLESVENFRQRMAVVEIDVETARRFGTVKGQLRRRGRPIPDNDVWLAATALRHDLIIATRDAHFEIVEHLRIERW